MEITPPPKHESAASPPRSALVWLMLTVAFFLLAVVFLLLPKGSGIPQIPSAAVNPASLSTAPRFDVLADPPRVVINSFERDCMDCHQLFTSHPDRSDRLNQHEEIIFNHGINNRCLNCHHETDRNKLTLRNGQKMDFAQVADTCGQCHGPTLRQWERGVHGKTMGYWNADMGTPQRLTCTQCHDPHSPSYEPITPLPGPNTHRMGDQHQDNASPHDAPHNPLRPVHLQHSNHESPPAPEHDSPQTPPHDEGHP